MVSVDERTNEEGKNKIINEVNKVAEDFSLELQIKPDYSYKLIRPKKKKNNAHVRVLYNQEKLRNIYKKKIEDLLQFKH